MSDESYALKILDSGLLDRVSERFDTLDTLDKCNINVNVDGSSMYYHRLLSLGCDPLWGFLWCTGHIERDMTTVDKREQGCYLGYAEL